MNPPVETNLKGISETPPAVLYHYTSLDAFLNIVTTGSIWATDVMYLNDSTESELVMSIARRRIMELALTSDGERRNVLQRLHDFTENGIARNSYIASFSDKRDDLSQWRGYCPPGVGICLGFSGAVVKFATHLPTDPAPYPKDDFFILDDRTSILSPAIYMSEVNSPSFDDLIEIACSKTEFPTPHIDPVRVAIYLLYYRAPFFKNDKFRDENEWRIVLGLSKHRLGGASIKFRQGKSTLVPYTEIDLVKHDPKFLTEVIVGSTPNMDLSVDAVKRFLQSKGMGHVIVEASDVPYRHW